MRLILQRHALFQACWHSRIPYQRCTLIRSSPRELLGLFIPLIAKNLSALGDSDKIVTVASSIRPIAFLPITVIRNLDLIIPRRRYLRKARSIGVRARARQHGC